MQNGSIASDVEYERAAVGVQLPRVAHLLGSEEEGKACFPPSLRNRVGGFMSKMGTGATSGYCNPRGGWAEARNATVSALQEAQKLGAELVGNAEVSSLIRQSGKVVGVKTSDGRSFTVRNGGAVIICAGSWTTELLVNNLLPPTLGKALGQPASTSGQTVITLKLGEEDRLAHKGAPVTFNIQTGFYTFAPDASGVLKAAIHGPGYCYPAPPCGVVGSACTYPSFTCSSSTTPTSTTVQPKGILGGRATPFQPTIQTCKEERVPDGKDREMLQQLFEVYPGLKKYESTLQTRICWYSDTLDENWIIDGVPGQHSGESVENLFIATGDSGHGFKVSRDDGLCHTDTAGGCTLTVSPLPLPFSLLVLSVPANHWQIHPRPTPILTASRLRPRPERGAGTTLVSGAPPSPQGGGRCCCCQRGAPG